MVRQIWRSAAFTAVAIALTVSCGWAAAIYATEISADQLAGRWANEAGTSLTFHADHTFTSEDFDKLPVASDCSHPSDLSSGRWAFYSETSSDETASRGTMLSLTFSADGCRVDTYLFGDEDDPSMCPTADPDEACDS